MSVPFTLASCLVASFFQSQHSLGATGYLLIVAFDIMLAGCIAPLFAMFYVDKPSPNAGFLSVLGGSVLRIILEFTLPKDGYLLLPFSGPEYLNYGPVSSDLYPGWFDVPPGDKWDPSTCEQVRFRDFTGVDSLVSPIFSLIVFVAVHYTEKYTGKNVLFFLPDSWTTPAPVVDHSAPEADDQEATKDEKVASMGIDTTTHSAEIPTQ